MAPILIDRSVVEDGDFWPDSIWRGYVNASSLHAGAEFIVLACGEICGVIFDRGTRWERRYMQGQRVEVHPDTYGHIAPGIHNPGSGFIAGFVNGTDHMFHVVMDSGEDGNVKLARLV